MSRFIESIHIKNGAVQNIELHDIRVQQTRKKILNIDDGFSLMAFIHPPSHMMNLNIKCRIVYSERVQEVTYAEYTVRDIRTLKMCQADHVEYVHKFEDRSDINALFDKAKSDEILMIKNGAVTDCRYYNTAFLKEGKWYTPSKPLLNGVKRSSLISKGVLNERQIYAKDISLYEKVSLINALTDLEQIILPITSIVQC